jgi:alkanesulfonate monooxygenase SsuD/methylene tetrahydromethanopterin reductase-like flavin-dependent oxidoreductase (luciferase family)
MLHGAAQSLRCRFVHFAISIPPFTDPNVIVDLAVDAETAGWDGVFLWDHLQWDAHLGLDIHDPWALLSAMAVRTQRVVLGTSVTPLARRRPWVLAKQVVTLDHLSGGRAVLGVGLGEPADADFEVFGEQTDAVARASILDDGLALLDKLLRGEAVSHHGRHFNVDAQLRPRPVQSPRPRIFVAGVYPHRKPRARALQWDGFFPISYPDFLAPEQIVDYLDPVQRPSNWDVYATLAPGHSVPAFAAAGVTWLVDGVWPVGDWVQDLRERVRAGPPT